MTAAPVSAPDAGRADARRNRAIVLRAAAQVFAEDGLDVSLGRIARRAGVGAGTVYRHFPSKQILVEAVLTDHVDGMVTLASRWTGRAAPGDALFGFLLDVIERTAGRKHVCDALAADRGWPRALLAPATQRFHAALDDLLSNAKQAGAIRPDVGADDLAALVAGGVALRSAHRNRARGERLVRLMLDGLRPAPVTEGGKFRDTSSRGRHETAAAGQAYCAECGTPLRVPPTGRRPRYCGAACRQRGHRRRVAE